MASAGLEISRSVVSLAIPASVGKVAERFEVTLRRMLNELSCALGDDGEMAEA